MPSLSSVQKNTQATWADQVDKIEISRIPFWIHNAKASEYQDSDGRDVAIIVLDITVNGPSVRDPRAVITLGRTEQREEILNYFAEEGKEPLGPCITYRVDMSGGRTFWRLEDAPDENGLQAEMFKPSASKRR